MKGYYVEISRNVHSYNGVILITGFNPTTVSVEYYYYECLVGLVIEDDRILNNYKYYPFYCNIKPLNSTL